MVRIRFFRRAALICMGGSGTLVRTPSISNTILPVSNSSQEEKIYVCFFFIKFVSNPKIYIAAGEVFRARGERITGTVTKNEARRSEGPRLRHGGECSTERSSERPPDVARIFDYNFFCGCLSLCLRRKRYLFQHNAVMMTTTRERVTRFQRMIVLFLVEHP